ncbi:MAG: SpoIVB peptidase S55 domain-containing protein [candidate division WOR-3 bacterium]
MRFRFRLLVLLIMAGRAVYPALPIMPVDSLKPGMKGTGYSVFSGTKPEPFQVEIIDVMHRTTPRGDIILARLSGAGLEQTGVIAGMSGSPVYIDGRLVGAVAYAWAFAKEPIAGITPAGEMLKIWELPDTVKTGAVRPLGSGYRSELNLPAVPLALSGFSSRLEALVAPVLSRHGLVPVAGGIAGSDDTAELVPGGAVGVALIDGDVRAAAIGTVTARDGNRILAFGHPMFLAGAVRLPLTGGRIHSVLPSMNISAKLFSPSKPVGVVNQDRLTGISGIIGPEAPMIPVRVHIQSPVTDDSYRFRVADHEQLTPDFLPVGLIQTVLQTEGMMEDYALETRVQLVFERQGRNRVEVRHLFSGTEPLSQMMEKFSAELALLFGNPIEPVSLRAVEAELKFHPGRRICQLISARSERSRVQPGDTFGILLRLRDYRGEETEKRVTLTVPPAASPGPLTLTLTSRDDFLNQELGDAGELAQPKTLDGLLRLLGESGREDELVIAGYVRKPGLRLDNQAELPQAPPSIQRVLGVPRSLGEVRPVPASRLFKTIVPLDRVVIGSATIEVEVK